MVLHRAIATGFAFGRREQAVESFQERRGQSKALALDVGGIQNASARDSRALDFRLAGVSLPG